MKLFIMFVVVALLATLSSAQPVHSSSEKPDTPAPELLDSSAPKQPLRHFRTIQDTPGAPRFKRTTQPGGCLPVFFKTGTSCDPKKDDDYWDAEPRATKSGKLEEGEQEELEEKEKVEEEYKEEEPEEEVEEQEEEEEKVEDQEEVEEQYKEEEPVEEVGEQEEVQEEEKEVEDYWDDDNIYYAD